MSEAAEKFNRIYDENTNKQAEERSTTETVETPSEIRKKQREIEDTIEELEKRVERLGARHHKMSERYARRGAPCPECGSKKKPKGGGFAQIHTATCPDCGFEGSCIH